MDGVPAGGGDAVQRRLRRPLPDPCLRRGLRFSEASWAFPPRGEVADTSAAGVSASDFGGADAPSSARAWALSEAAPVSVAAGASAALSLPGAAGASGVTLLPDSAGTSGAVLLLAAPGLSAGVLLSAFAGAAGASVVVSLPVTAVSAGAVAGFCRVVVRDRSTVRLAGRGRRGLGRHGPGSGLSVFRGWRRVGHSGGGSRIRRR